MLRPLARALPNTGGRSCRHRRPQRRLVTAANTANHHAKHSSRRFGRRSRDRRGRTSAAGSRLLSPKSAVSLTCNDPACRPGGPKEAPKATLSSAAVAQRDAVDGQLDRRARRAGRRVAPCDRGISVRAVYVLLPRRLRGRVRAPDVAKVPRHTATPLAAACRSKRERVAHVVPIVGAGDVARGR